MKKIIAGVLTIMLLAFLCFGLFSGDLTRHAFGDTGGLIQVGTRFGISIGDGQKTVADKLNKIDLKIDNISRNKKCVSRDVIGEYVIYSYDMSWRKGVICIGIEKNKVRSIAWSFSPLAP